MNWPLRCWCGYTHGEGVIHVDQFVYIVRAPTMTDRDPLLQEREKTHGDFSIQGRWAKEMKDHLRQTPNFDEMQGCKGEALDMIVTKISRILHGQANLIDSWEDIAGYAKLGAEACK